MKDAELLRASLQRASDYEGGYLELGVLWGETFQVITSYAKEASRTAYAFDSFKGMGEPSKYDIDPNPLKPQYPKGRFDTKGYGHLAKKLHGYDNYVIIEGFVPSTFARYPEEKVAFAHLDLDHYYPTKDSIKWLWHEKNVGILLCDDFPNSKERFAAKAIHEFMEEEKPVVFGQSKNKIAFCKEHKENG